MIGKEQGYCCQCGIKYHLHQIFNSILKLTSNIYIYSKKKSCLGICAYQAIQTIDESQFVTALITEDNFFMNKNVTIPITQGTF